MSAPTVGIQIPTVDGHAHGYSDLRPMVRAAERVGFSSVWFGDHLLSNVPIVESVVAATTAAAVSEHVHVGFAVMLPALRHPVWLAKQLCSLQVVSGGRLELGIGVGGEIRAEWELAGVPIGERGRRTDRFLAALPQMMTGQSAVLGEPWNLTVPPLLPSAGMPPLWIGGRSEAALRRAVRSGAGWMGLWVDEARLIAANASMTEMAEELGVAAPVLGVQVMVHLGADKDAAESEVAQFMEAIYRIPYEKICKWVAVGDFETVVERVATLVNAGAQTVVLIPAMREFGTHIDDLGDIAAEVRLRSTCESTSMTR